jgi:DNA-binding transcriptional ArsR family regulator
MDGEEIVDLEEIRRRVDEVLGPPRRPPRVTRGTLDTVLGSRTHVRVLRVLVALHRRVNLTARDVARRAGRSHSRVLEVLEQLSSLRVVKSYRTPTHAIYRLADEHPLTVPVRSLFDEERKAAEEQLEEVPRRTP